MGMDIEPGASGEESLVSRADGKQMGMQAGTESKPGTDQGKMGHEEHGSPNRPTDAGGQQTYIRDMNQLLEALRVRRQRSLGRWQAQ